MFISEIIKTQTMKSWGMHSKIFINAPMGSGKTYFIVNRLIPWALQNHWRVLIVCNRINLKAAYGEELQKVVASVAAELARDQQDFYYLTRLVQVITYQALAENPYRDNVVRANQLLVCDEIHALYADSIFATKSILAYQAIIQNCAQILSIFMSATPENIFPKIIHDLSVQGNMDVQQDFEGGYCIPNYYVIPPDYDYLTCKVTSDLQNIVSQTIKDKESSEKWIYFVPSIAEGNQIRHMLITGGIARTNIAMLTRANLSTSDTARSVSEKIIQEGYFEEKVLIATQVVEAGISIKDTKVRHLVNLHFVRETFIQCIGRKRVVPGEQVQLYLLARDCKTFSTKANQLAKAIQILHRLTDLVKANNLWAYTTEVGNSLMNSDESINSFVYLLTMEFGRNVGLVPCINELSVEKIYRDYAMFLELAKKLKADHNAFLEIQLGWIQQKLADVEWLADTSEVACSALLDQKLLLFAKAGKLTKGELIRCKVELAGILSRFYPKMFRADRSPSDDKINKQLEELGLPYRIECEKKRTGNTYQFVCNKSAANYAGKGGNHE